VIWDGHRLDERTYPFAGVLGLFPDTLLSIAVRLECSREGSRFWAGFAAGPHMPGDYKKSGEVLTTYSS
jgi:hypothetical protein